MATTQLQLASRGGVATALHYDDVDRIDLHHCACKRVRKADSVSIRTLPAVLPAKDLVAGVWPRDKLDKQRDLV